jgi:hypothetical protein
MGGGALASDSGRAALAWIIAARRFGPGEATASDHLTEPESLTRELIDAPDKKASPPFASIAGYSIEFSRSDRWASTI